MVKKSSSKIMPHLKSKYEDDYFVQRVEKYQVIFRKESSLGRKVSQTAVIILIYFILSISLTFYQQWLYSSYRFNLPLGTVLIHLIVKYFLAVIIRRMRKCRNKTPLVKLEWKNILFSLAPPGIASGFDVALSNWSISLITMSLYTMTKSTTIIFILGFSLLFKLEKMSWLLVSIVGTISGGLIMFTYESTQFRAFGFIVCLLAAFSSGIRWTMAQMVMQKSKLGLNNPIDIIYHIQPWMFISVLPMAVWFEGSTIYTGLINTDWNNILPVVKTAIAVLAGALLAFKMEVMEFLVVTHTSSLTLSIAGILKEICILFLAYEIKGDRMSSLNFLGLLMCLGGIILHVAHKILVTQATIKRSEIYSNPSIKDIPSKDEGIDTNLPLLTQNSNSFMNLLSEEFSSNEDLPYDLQN